MKMNETSSFVASLPATYCIRALLPDDGSDKRLLTALLHQKNIIRADSVAVRSVGMLHAVQIHSDNLSKSDSARLVTVLVDAADADALFSYVFSEGRINRPGGGLVTMARLAGASCFTLPSDVPFEKK